MKLSINRKLMLIILLAIVLPSFIGGVVLYREVEKSIGFARINDLMNMVDARYVRILDFLEQEKSFIENMGKNRFLRTNLSRLLHAEGALSESEKKAFLAQIQTYISHMQKSPQLDWYVMKEMMEKGISFEYLFGGDVEQDVYRYHEILIINPAGKVISSSKEASIGADMAATEIFKKGRMGAFVKNVHVDINGKPAIAFSAPLVEKHSHEPLVKSTQKTFLGVVVLKVGTDFLTDLTTGDYANKTEESLFITGNTSSTDFYLINQDGYMITRPRQLNRKQDAILKRQSKTLPWQHCINDSPQVPGMQGYYANYAGVEVGGAFRCIPDLKWVVVVEQDKDEILMLYTRIGKTMAIIGLMVAIAITCLLLFMIRKLLLIPIAKLSEATRQMNLGNYDVRVNINATDEVGMLGDYFNKMAGDVQKAMREAKENEKEIEESLRQLTHEVIAKEQARNELLVNNQQLEELIKWRTKELSEANIQLLEEAAGRKLAQIRAEQANQTKSDFLANMSHELRTPMHAILSFAEIGQAKVGAATDEKLRGYFSRINESGHRLLNLLNDLLDLSKLEAGRMEFDLQKHSLKEVVDMAVLEFSELVREKSLQLEIVQPQIKTEARFDRGKILQVVCNLLSNAIKFTPAGEKINISFASATVSSSKPGEGENRHQLQAILVVVRDHGIGIPEAELESVFNKFVQSSKTKTGCGGTGLGLAISEEIIHRHGGTIWAESNPEGGAVFCFTVPC